MIHEGIFWQPSKISSAYSLSKYMAEMEVWRGITEGLNAVIVNPSVILGPENYRKNSAPFFKIVGLGLPFYTLGMTGFVDVRDVTKIMIELMDSKTSGERFILSSENISYQSLFEIIAEALRVNPPKIYIPRWMSEIVWRLEHLKTILLMTPRINRSTVEISYKHLLYSSDKIKQFLNFEFRSIKESIHEFAIQHQK